MASSQGELTKQLETRTLLAAVDVHAVAVGVDGEVVDGEVVDAGEEQAEVAALENREVAEEDVAAVLERDGFVAYAGLLGLEHGVVAARRADGWRGGGARDARVRRARAGRHGRGRRRS